MTAQWDGRTATEPQDAGGTRTGPAVPGPAVRGPHASDHAGSQPPGPELSGPGPEQSGKDLPGPGLDGPGLPATGPSDAELLRRHVAGDPDAFSELFRRHRDRLWAIAIRTLADPEEAADAVQDAMISAFRRAGSFRGDSAVTTWLHRIVVNACLDRLRRKAVRPAASGADERALDTLALGHAIADPSAASDTSLDVRDALRTLPPDQQAALVLVDMLGYPVADAAAVLGISQGTVKSRCARARARLLPRLEHLRRGSGGSVAPAGNRSTAPNVSPAQGGGDSQP